MLGTIFSEYFFCFHLLNIVNNNQLLARVIKAVTTNGTSAMLTSYDHYDVIDFVFVAKRRGTCHYDVNDIVFVAKRRGT